MPTPAHVDVLKYDEGIIFCICGVPGKATIANEKIPIHKVAGKSLFGISALRNISAPNGYMTNATTNTLKPP